MASEFENIDQHLFYSLSRIQNKLIKETHFSDLLCKIHTQHLEKSTGSLFKWIYCNKLFSYLAFCRRSKDCSENFYDNFLKSFRQSTNDQQNIEILTENEIGHFIEHPDSLAEAFSGLSQPPKDFYYSTIPSLFGYFLTQYGQKQFLSFLSKMNSDRIVDFIRPLLVLPQFTSFIYNVATSDDGEIIFSQIFLDKPENLERLRSNFLEKVGKYINQFPKIILDAIKCARPEKQQEIFNDSLIQPIMNFPHIFYFNPYLVDMNLTDFFDNSQFKKSLWRLISESPLSDVSLTEPTITSLLTHNDFLNLSKLIQTQKPNIDTNQLIHEQTNNNSAEELKLYQFTFTQPTQSCKKTNDDDDLFENLFRNILLTIRPIDIPKHPIRHIDFFDFLRSHVTPTCDRIFLESQIKELENLITIKNRKARCDLWNLNTLIKLLDSKCQERMKQFEGYSNENLVFNSIEKDLQFIYTPTSTTLLSPFHFYYLIAHFNFISEWVTSNSIENVTNNSLENETKPEKINDVIKEQHESLSFQAHLFPFHSTYSYFILQNLYLSKCKFNLNEVFPSEATSRLNHVISQVFKNDHFDLINDYLRTIKFHSYNISDKYLNQLRFLFRVQPTPWASLLMITKILSSAIHENRLCTQIQREPVIVEDELLFLLFANARPKDFHLVLVYIKTFFDTHVDLNDKNGVFSKQFTDLQSTVDKLKSFEEQLCKSIYVEKRTIAQILQFQPPPKNNVNEEKK